MARKGRERSGGRVPGQGPWAKNSSRKKTRLVPMATNIILTNGKKLIEY